MFEHFTDYLISFLQGFKHHQFSLYFCVFLMALLESIPFIGTFMPGTLILLIFGVFAAKGYGSLGLMILLSVIGATVGDIVGYLLGRFGRKFFNDQNRLLKISHIHTGEAFFTKHGGKSVLFGRFIGPIRPIISLVAGATKMLPSLFLQLNLLGAFIWAGTYITIGSVFARHIRLIDKIVSEISTSALVIIVLCFGIYFYFKKRATIMKD